MSLRRDLSPAGCFHPGQPVPPDTTQIPSSVIGVMHIRIPGAKGARARTVQNGGLSERYIGVASPPYPPGGLMPICACRPLTTCIAPNRNQTSAEPDVRGNRPSHRTSQFEPLHDPLCVSQSSTVAMGEPPFQRILCATMSDLRARPSDQEKAPEFAEIGAATRTHQTGSARGPGLACVRQSKLVRLPRANGLF